MNKKEETVKVTVQVPKRLMNLIEEANYFGRNKEAFFQVCVKYGVGCCLSVMPFDKEKLLTTKYPKKLLEVQPTKEEKKWTKHMV